MAGAPGLLRTSCPTPFGPVPLTVLFKFAPGEFVKPEALIPTPFKVLIMAGAPGFEPGNAGIKTQCLNRLATPQ